MRLPSIVFFLTVLFQAGAGLAQQVPAPQAATVQVRVEADGGRATLYRKRTTVSREELGKDLPDWVPVCPLPCASILPLAETYRIQGPWIMPSPKFVLPALGARIRVRTAHRALVGAQGLLLAGGIVAAVFGTAGLLQDQGLESAVLGSSGRGLDTGLLLGGLIAAGVAGGLLWFTRTRIMVTPGPG